MKGSYFLKQGITKLVDSLVSGILTNLSSLSLNGCFTGRKKTQSMEKLQQLISSPFEKCPLESLFIASDPKDSKTQLKRDDLLPFIFNLLTNETLTELDVSHHLIGDNLAIALAKVLQTNVTLQTLVWDGNGTTPAGFKKFYLGLQKNNSLRHMPMPVMDISNATKNVYKEKYTPSWSELINSIQEKISTNAGHKKEKIQPMARQIMKKMITVMTLDWQRVDESYNIPATQLADHISRLKASESSRFGTNGFDLEYSVNF